MPVPAFVPFGGQEFQAPLSKARIAVLPLAHESAPSYGTGAKDGPFHILDASTQLETTDEETLSDWTSPGIHTLSPPGLSALPREALGQIRAAALPLLESGKKLLSLGGDHAVSIGLVEAAKTIFPGLGVLQIDAHLDLRDTWNQSPLNHACVMRRIREDFRLPAVQVGIRSFSQEEATLAKEKDYRIFFAHQMLPKDDSWIDQAVNCLPETVYLSLDLDGLDPSVVPGTGTPEPGGLTYRQVVDLLKALGKKRQVVAADITELAAFEGNHVSEYTAARLAQKIFVHCFQ